MTDLNLVVGIFVFVTGLCIGSFLNVVILRALSGESIIFPASKCPVCQTPLKWWHNIPLISYIFLRGKCAFCKTKISIQYPIIEFLTGYLYLMTFMKFGYSFNTLFIMAFLSMFIVISTTDIREHVEFNIHCYILAFLGLVYNFFNFGNLYHGYTWIFHTSFMAAILGLIAGAGLIALYCGLGYLIFKTPVAGAGDIFIAGALGACFGWKYILYILVASVFIQVLAFLPIFLHKLYKKRDFITIAELAVFAVLMLLTYCFYSIVWNILLAVTGIFICKRIIESLPKDFAEQNKEMLNNESDVNGSTFKNNDISHLPFGPALCLAALLFIFLH